MENSYVKNLKDDFIEFMYNRLDKTEYALEKNDEYKELQNKCSKIYKEIYEMVGEEGQSLLETYYTLNMQIYSMGTKSSYTTGLRDSENLKHCIN